MVDFRDVTRADMGLVDRVGYCGHILSRAVALHTYPSLREFLSQSSIVSICHFSYDYLMFDFSCISEGPFLQGGRPATPPYCLISINLAITSISCMVVMRNH